MIIPRSQGTISSQPTLQQHTPVTGLQDLGRSIGGAIQARDQQQQEQEITAKRIELNGNKIAEAEAKVKLDDVLTTEMSEQVTLLKNEVSNGKANAAVANESLKKWSNDRYKQIEGELPLHAQKDLKQYWDANITNQAPGFLPLQLRADTEKSIQLVDRVFDIATRYDEDKGEEYLKTYLDGAKISEMDKNKYIEKYKTTRNVLSIDSRITNAIADKDITDLKTLVTDLDSGKYAYIDGSTAQQKKAQALSRIDAINKQSEVEENKRLTKAGKELNDFKSQVLTGRDLDSDYKDKVAQFVKGTEYEAEYNFYSQQSANFQSFGRKSSSEQLALINQQKAKAKNSKTTDAVNEEKILGVYESLYAEKLKVGKENPNQLVREAGLKVNELSVVELKTNPRSWVEKAIDNGVSQKALKDANIALAPISKEDLPEAKKAFEDMSINQKLDLMGSLIDKSKGIKGGQEIWKSTLKQLGDGNSIYITAATAKANNFKSTQGRDLSTSIISGNQLLKNKQITMPKEADLKAAFNSYVGQSITGTSANTAYEAFRAVYADTMHSLNKSHDKADEAPNKEALNAALSFSTGGVYEQKGKFINYLGDKTADWKVAKPYGMKNDTFESRVNAGYGAISHATGIPSDDLRDLKLKQSSQRTKEGDLQYDLLNERGNPLVVKGVTWRIRMQGVKN